MTRQTSRLLSVINKIEDWFVIILLAVMIVLAVAQIFYRNLFGEGVVWIDPLLRVLVLWVAVAGAVIATRTDNHIRIDFFTRYLTKIQLNYLRRAVYAFCVLVCSFIAWNGVLFVQMDYEFETIAFENVPAWLTELIIPIGFFLIALRYFLLFISPPEQDTL